MVAAKKTKGVDPELAKAVQKMLRDVMKDPASSLTDKCKAVDRALKLEQIKQRLNDDGYGTGFFTDEEELP